MDKSYFQSVINFANANHLGHLPVLTVVYAYIIREDYRYRKCSFDSLRHMIGRMLHTDNVSERALHDAVTLLTAMYDDRLHNAVNARSHVVITCKGVARLMTGKVFYRVYVGNTGQVSVHVYTPWKRKLRVDNTFVNVGENPSGFILTTFGREHCYSIFHQAVKPCCDIVQAMNIVVEEVLQLANLQII